MNREAKLSPNQLGVREYFRHSFGKYIDIGNSSLLEIGIGDGIFGRCIADLFERYCGIDNDPEMVELAKKKSKHFDNIDYRGDDAETIWTFNEGEFDMIFYTRAWHFIRNKTKALRRARELLKNEGIVAILEPSSYCNNSRWASNSMNIGHPDFDQKKLRDKFEKIKQGEDFLLTQDLFEVVERDTGCFDKRCDLYVLKPKSNKQ